MTTSYKRIAYTHMCWRVTVGDINEVTAPLRVHGPPLFSLRHQSSQGRLELLWLKCKQKESCLAFECQGDCGNSQRYSILKIKIFSVQVPV